MKKTYKNPTLKVVNVKPARILAGSPTIGLSSTNYNGSTNIETRGSRYSSWEEQDAAVEE